MLVPVVANDTKVAQRLSQMFDHDGTPHSRCRCQLVNVFADVKEFPRRPEVPDAREEGGGCHVIRHVDCYLDGG
jgi:hypothetical protein